MSAQEIVAHARKFKIPLWRAGGLLNYEAPYKALTHKLHTSLINHNAGILEIIEFPAQTTIFREK